MQSIDTILLILTCETNRTKALQQKNTWLKTLPAEITYFHVLGNPNLKTDFAFDHVENILYVRTKDDFISRPHKIISAYEAIYNTYHFKYVLKMDDAQTPLADNFFQALLNNLSSEFAPHYGGKITTIDSTHISTEYNNNPELPKNILLQATTYCTGRFYVLSTNAVASLLPYKTRIAQEYLEDYAIGLYLDPSYKKNAMLIKSDILFV